MPKPDKTNAHAAASAPTPQDFKDSQAIDSPLLAQWYKVNDLPKLPDDTTGVRYHFADDSPEQDLCMRDAKGPVQCGAPGDLMREAVQDAMQGIVRESGAKIRFDETASFNDADVVFLERHGHDDRWVAASSKAEGKPYIVLNPEATRATIHDVWSEAFKNRVVAQRVRETFGNNGAEDRFLLTDLTREAANEIEHRLGGKGVAEQDSRIGTAPAMNDRTLAPDPTFSRTVMGNFLSDQGHTIGPVDAAWYQRHFGKAEHAAQDEVKAPAPASAAGEPAQKTR